MKSQSKTVDVIIIGAGAAGLMCAIEAAKRKRNVLLLEKSGKVGKKILISGGGRCNFTNMYTSPDDYLSDNPHFCKSALSRYSPWDFIALMEKHQLGWTEKTLGQLFCDQKSAAIVNMLLDECSSAGVTTQLESDIHSISKQGDQFLVKAAFASQETQVQAQSLVVATGGPSIPAMGSTDFAMQLAHQFSINTIPFKAALVPFTFDKTDYSSKLKELAGISLFVELTTLNVSFKEAILFTHRGISGPAALQISSYWKPGKPIHINLFPDENVFDWLLTEQQKHPLAKLKTVLSHKLPKRLAHKLCELFLNPPVLNIPIKQISQPQLEALAEKLTHWGLTPAGTEGMRTAEVSLGGIDTEELSSKTFESKSVKGLYFVGECIDVTGHLGGYNFQWAWASGWCAGQFV
jgi:predicted Rossmann fold flavoprotein